jgi:hypothetical protein
MIGNTGWTKAYLCPFWTFCPPEVAARLWKNGSSGVKNRRSVQNSPKKYLDTDETQNEADALCRGPNAGRSKTFHNR